MQIISTFTFIGFHSWPNADSVRRPDLKTTHRHLFYVRLEQRVYHNDRQIEFQQLANDVRMWLFNEYPILDVGGLDLNNASCEIIAERIGVRFLLDAVEVWEDKENGARWSKS